MSFIERPSRASANVLTAGSRPSIVLGVTIAVSVTRGPGGDGGLRFERIMSTNQSRLMALTFTGPGADALVDGMGVTVEAG